MKKNVWKRHAALALIGTMAIGSLYGCGNKSTTSDPTQATTGIVPTELAPTEKKS